MKLLPAQTKSALVGCLLAGTLLTLPASGYAQEAEVNGTVTDSTGGVLPGVTITAVHEATGNVFEVVTDETGTYRLPVRVGTLRITAQLAGFRTVTRTGVELLLGQLMAVDLQLSPATVSETVTVTGEAPLIDSTSSTIGANIDPRQMSELPINGRDWMGLALLAPGARRNEGGGMAQFRQGYSQTNVDGQQMTVNYHSQTDSEQPGFSRDAIAEFQVVANRFDATQGRSSGMIVNAITKSGTNTFAGTLGGYFRDDRFNAEDFIEKRVLPYSNQQASGTFGGPILRDRIHFFGSYEYERQPTTYYYTTQFQSFNVDTQFTSGVHKALGRLDYQFTPQTRLSVRGSGYNNLYYAIGGAGGGTTHPSAGGTRGRIATQYFGTFTQVLSNRTVNEIRAGMTDYERQDQPAARWKGGDMPYHPVLLGSTPVIQLSGLTIGANTLNIFQDTQTIRDDFTTSYEWRGRHDLRLGGEYFRFHNDYRWCSRCNGEIDARGGPIPTNIESLFPVWNDASTWNLAPLAPITRWVFHTVSDTEHVYGSLRHVVAGWVQDDWKVSNALTLNLGVRYDMDSNAHSEKLRFLPWLPGDQPHDTNNVAPRVGVNYSLNDRTVLRGGYGLFFAFAPNDGVQQTDGYQHRFEYQIFPDGRADFVPNWFGSGPSPHGQGWGGPWPSWDESLRRACDTNFVSGCVIRAMNQEINYPGRRTSYAHQAGVGVQRQLGADMSFEANYVFTGGRLEESSINANLSYNPATSANYRFSDASRRPFPQWGLVNFELLEGWSNYNAGDFTLTKRFSNRWQASGTYTLGFFRDAEPVRDQWYLGSDGVVARRALDFPLAPDLGGDYGFAGAHFAGGAGASGDQRHRVAVNGIFDAGYGFQLSGIYFFGSGERRRTSTGVDRRDEGAGANAASRLRADGTIMPRNGLVGDPLHRVDVRIQKRLPLGGRTTVDGIFEIFNLFNHANYGTYTTNESSTEFGRPAFSDNIAYQARMMQVGFRLAF